MRLHEAQRLDSLGLDLTIMQTPEGGDSERLLRIISQQIPDALLDLNTRYSLAGKSCAGDKCYGHRLIGWRTGGATGCGRTVRLGMIDTPVDTTDAALAGQQLRTRSFVQGREPAPNAHGTAIATLLVGGRSPEFTGLLPGATLLAANAFYRTEDGVVTTNARFLLKALDWLLQEQVELVNLSLTGPPNTLLQEAMARVQASGMIAVAAAGNGGTHAPAAYPAAYPGVIAVTALDRFFRPYEWANRGDYVSFAAPGVDIWTPTGGGDGTYHSGTSFASAFVAGVAADLLARTSNRADVIHRLRGSTRDLGAAGRDPVFGWGLVNGTAPDLSAASSTIAVCAS
jgi:subtilisin family serine protease